MIDMFNKFCYKHRFNITGLTFTSYILFLLFKEFQVIRPFTYHCTVYSTSLFLFMSIVGYTNGFTFKEEEE